MDDDKISFERVIVFSSENWKEQLAFVLSTTSFSYLLLLNLFQTARQQLRKIYKNTGFLWNSKVFMYLYGKDRSEKIRILAYFTQWAFQWKYIGTGLFQCYGIYVFATYKFLITDMSGVFCWIWTKHIRVSDQKDA